MALVTVAQINAALRLDLQGEAPGFAADERTPDVELKIKQAEDIVLDFVQPKPDPAWTGETVPGRVSAAIILAVSYLMDETDAGNEALAALAGGDPSAQSPIVGLLRRLRTPTLA